MWSYIRLETALHQGLQTPAILLMPQLNGIIQQKRYVEIIFVFLVKGTSYGPSKEKTRRL